MRRRCEDKNGDGRSREKRVRKKVRSKWGEIRQKMKLLSTIISKFTFPDNF